MPRSHGGGHRPVLDPQAMRAVVRFVRSTPDATLDELREQVREQTGHQVSRSTMCRAVRRTGWRRKKTLHASERDTPRVRRARTRFCRRTAGLAAKRFVFIDESGVNITLACRYARAPGGERAHGAAPINWSHNVSLIGVLSTAGVVAAMSVAGSTDAEGFCA